MSVNPENLDVDFVPPRFNLCLFEKEADEETDSLSYRRREFQSVIENLIAGQGYEDENRLEEIREVSLKKNERIVQQ